MSDVVLSAVAVVAVAAVIAMGVQGHLSLSRRGLATRRTRSTMLVGSLIALSALTPSLVLLLSGGLPKWVYTTMVAVALGLSAWWWLWRDRQMILAVLAAPDPGTEPLPGVLYIYRGLPGCGKSTRARAWVEEDRDHRARVNRDDMRRMLHGAWCGLVTETQVTTACLASIRELLRMGVSVACDDTNLREGAVQALLLTAAAVGAVVEFVDMRAVPLTVCLTRNAKREGAEHVPDEKIIKMWEDHIKPRRKEIARLN